MKNRILIHVGMPKTGTTSLQMNLLSRHAGVHYLGKPLTRVNPDMDRMTRGITYDTTLESTDRLRAFKQQVVNPLLAGTSRPVVISEEEFSTSTPTSEVTADEIANRLGSLFPGAHILITVRSQVSAIQSMYRHLRRMGFLGEISIERWFEGCFNVEQYVSLFDYHEVFLRYQQRFGAGCVHLLPFEWMRENPERFVRDICGLANADSDVGWSLWRAGRPQNSGHGLKAHLSAEQKARVRARFRSSNQKLAAVTGLELGGLNYAV